MKNIQLILLIYLMIINILTFMTYGMDKRKAKKNQWRTSERTLILLAVIGGSIGAKLGMSVFHHKTKHPKFYIGIPLILILQIGIFIFFYFYL